jgi:hypothetical protein
MTNGVYKNPSFYTNFKMLVKVHPKKVLFKKTVLPILKLSRKIGFLAKLFLGALFGFYKGQMGIFEISINRQII